MCVCVCVCVWCVCMCVCACVCVCVHVSGCVDRHVLHLRCKERIETPEQHEQCSYAFLSASLPPHLTNTRSILQRHLTYQGWRAKTQSKLQSNSCDVSWSWELVHILWAALHGHPINVWILASFIV